MILIKILPVCYLFTCCIQLSLIQTILVAAKEEEELKHDMVHKLMSEKDLQRTFQVDSHDQVPEYEILKLTVNDDGSHLISPISDLGELSTAPSNTPAATFNHEQLEEEEHLHGPSGANSKTSTRHKRSSQDTDGATDHGQRLDPVGRSGPEKQAHKLPARNPSDQDGPACEGAMLEDDDKLIVMKLSTFGRDFKLRLKRNADFQQRIKDMKMFMAESTKDGQLRYTEIKPLASTNERQQQQHQHDANKQEPHKRSASGSPDQLLLDQQPEQVDRDFPDEPAKSAPGAPKSHAQARSQVWNIGATYHDEDNLAALLIDHDKRTGLLQVDGTIGNDFVIKPMPQLELAKAAGQRARRAAARARQVSHHIVYRQRPSSESSSEHQHSFMVSPSEMEHLAASFSPQRLLHKRSSSPGNAMDDLDDAGTDSAGDPLGGQFYLEPGFITGTQRAGYSDWSLLDQRQPRAPPPYALNSTSMLNSTSNNHLHLQNRTQARHKRSPRRFNGRPSPQVRRKRQAPDTVWPEVLLVVDYDSFLLHGGDSRDVKRYFVSFWNGVDLRYKLLVHPHIRISLAGMIVAKDRDATPYLERNRLRAPNADAVDAAGALTDMGKYLYREDRLPTYDLAVVITKLDMCRRRYEGGRCNRGTAGFAYVGGACVVNKRLEKVNSVAIIEDSGGFSGVIVAAHEVGHLLGCVHDGSPPPSYLGGPGATHCPWEDGFIMSDLRHTERGFRWSQCSVDQFKHFLNGETATCLYNYPHESQMLHRLLPGTMLSLDEQCKRDRGTNACFKDARVCAQLFCFDSASGYCVSYRPAAEGSPCGEGQVCRNGKCVGEIENIIPDYTHQSQTIVARRPALASVTHSARLASADNGLSASSTSTATSSPPDTRLASTAGGTSPALTSRMDTFSTVVMKAIMNQQTTPSRANKAYNANVSRLKL